MIGGHGAPELAPDSAPRAAALAGRVQTFQRLLLAWHAEHASELPWRRAPDPYSVLVSEFMLQQTQRARVAPIFEQFMATFPTLEVLASAGRAEVIRAWAGLGYNRRAVRLHDAARQLVQIGWGEGSPAALRELPGVGEYTACALACFGFDVQVAAVDTNAVRVLRRVLCGEPYPKPKPAFDRALARSALAPGSAREWNSAIMDLGATICSAATPHCADCPVVEACLAAPELSAGGADAGRIAEKRAGYGVVGHRGEAPERFEQSNRFLRGRIVAALRALAPGETLALEALAAQVSGALPPADPARVLAQTKNLVRDGLAVTEHDEFGAARFRLPD